MKKTRKRRELLRRSESSPSGCRNTARLILQACEAFCVNSLSPWMRLTRHKVRIRRSIVPKLIKMKEMSNSNQKSPRQRINWRKRPKHRPRLKPSQKPPEALQVQFKPKRNRQRSSCRLNKSSEIIQVRRQKNSLQWAFLAGELIWFDNLINRTAYVPTSRLLAILKVNVRHTPTTRAFLSLKARSPFQLTPKRRSLARKAYQNLQNQSKKVSTILNFWLELSKSQLV